MTFDEWWEDFEAEYADSAALRRAAFQAGAASRDAEVVSLMNQRDYEYVRAENAEHDRLLVKIEIAAKDAEIAGLVAALDAMHNDSEECLDFDEFTAMLVPMDNWHLVFDALAKVRKP